MADIGRVNSLVVVKKAPFGIYLDGGDHGEILLPQKEVPNSISLGDSLDVFVYQDSEEQFIATTQRPYAMVGEFAYLKVAGLSNVGAFLDWGLPKDLLVPKREQRVKMEEGRSYIVYLNLDNFGRIYATSKIDKYLDIWPANYTPGQEVDLLICENSDIGIKAIINDRHWGLLFKDEVFRPLKYGQRIKGYVKQVRDDNKIDLVLNPPGHEKLEPVAEKIFATLKQKGGFMPVHDKTAPEVIYKEFGESKKSFKNAIGRLYKKKLITIGEDGIRIVE